MAKIDDTKQGRIILAEWAWFDAEIGVPKAKRRPVLVVSNDWFHQVGNCFAVEVTKGSPRVGFHDLFLSDWQALGLDFPSTVRADNLRTFGIRLVKTPPRMGCVKTDVFGWLTSSPA